MARWEHKQGKPALLRVPDPADQLWRGVATPLVPAANVRDPQIRALKELPKAHLHLHFTGAMRPATMVEMAAAQGVRLPAHLLTADPLRVPADQRGWFRFQRSYDAARALVKSETAMRRVLREAAEDDLAEGAVRLEIQIDPTSYAPYVGGITPALEIVLDEAAACERELGLSIGVIVAASRMRHPLEARTLARLAVRYAGDGPGEVIGFGLSNDERAGETASFARAFAIARRGGLAALPHGGELRGPDHIRKVVKELAPARLGHGVRAAEDPELLARIVAAGIGLEVCPTSNVSLGVFQQAAQVPLRQLLDAGAQIALSADDPLLFRSRLLAQYQVAVAQGCGSTDLAALAAASIALSFAPAAAKARWLRTVAQWREKYAGGLPEAE